MWNRRCGAFSVTGGQDERLQIYFVDNGYLYYQIKELDNKSDEDLIEYTQDLPSSLKTKKLNKFTKLKNGKYKISPAILFSPSINLPLITLPQPGPEFNGNVT